MDRRGLIFLFCLLTAVSAEGEEKKPLISVTPGEESVTLKCNGGTFENNNSETLTVNWDQSGDYTCKKDENVIETITVKFRRSEDLIQLDIAAVLTVLLSDIAATALIGWAVYSICAQPKTRSSYQGNKASDRQNLISNSAGDTYQPLNTRSDEYSSLQPARKNRSKNQPLSP